MVPSERTGGMSEKYDPRICSPFPLPRSRTFSCVKGIRVEFGRSIHGDEEPGKFPLRTCLKGTPEYFEPNVHFNLLPRNSGEKRDELRA